MSHEINIDSNGHIVLAIKWRSVVKVLSVLALTAGAGLVPLDGLTTASRLLALLAAFAVLLSNFMSNTAAANLIIPIIVSLGVFPPGLGAITIAFACLLAMSLPINTPPNTIPFATQIIESKNMARYGSIVSLFGMVFLLAIIYLARATFKRI